MKQDGGPAFPRRLPDVRVPPADALRIVEQHAGMSLRDFFAAAALQGLCAAHSAEGEWTHGSAEHTVRTAYAMADAMISHREKP